jgi:penicillin-binding protein 1A
LINAFIAVEDIRFYKHKGVDIKGIIRAIFKNLKSLSIKEGASTITQQLARNLFLTQEKTISRKLQEIALALKIEKKYTKEEILERYLNKIYFGHGMYGVESASLFYFNKHVNELNLAEAAMLAGIPKNPAKFSPFNNKELALLRQKVILNKMAEAGFIEPEEIKKATTYLEYKIKDILKHKMPTTKKQSSYMDYFIEYIRQYLENKYGTDMVYKGGLKVYTTLNETIQKVATSCLEKHLKILNQRKQNKNNMRIEGAVVIIDAYTGDIKGLVGGSGFSKTNQLNRAVQASRQPGSAFKPFIYASALEVGFKPTDFILDVPVKYKGAGEKLWMPENYDGIYRGTVTLMEALQKSINVATVKLLEKIGPSKVIALSHKLGIESFLEPNLALALGVNKVSPLELARAYCPFVNLGFKVKPIFIKYVRDKYGNLLEENLPELNRALSEDVAYTLLAMLRRVVEAGTGVNAQVPDCAIAGKTGTTQNFVDAWFVGLTPRLVVCVWLGYDKGNISLGENWCGAVVSAPIFRDIIASLKDYISDAEFPIPSCIEFAYIDLETGLLATDNCKKIVKVPFPKGKAPKEYCKKHLGIPYEDKDFYEIPCLTSEEDKEPIDKIKLEE